MNMNKLKTLLKICGYDSKIRTEDVICVCKSFINDKLVDETIDLSSYLKKDVYKTFSEINDCHNLVSEYLPFLEAEKLYHTYKSDLKGIERWIEYCLTIKPDNIPYDPWNYYKSEFPFLNIFENPNYFDDINIERTNIFLEKVKLKRSSHSGKNIYKNYNNYNHRYVKYIDNEVKIVIICKTHGSFIKSPHHYLSSDSCCKVCTANLDNNKLYTKDICEMYAKQCKTIKEFIQKYGHSVYGACRNFGKNDESWYKHITAHMEILGSRNRRLIYAYEFVDNSIYVGLTYNPNERDRQHKISGSVFNHTEQTGLIADISELTEFLEVEEAKRMEEYYVDYFREKGKIILNKVKTGGIGGQPTKWTYEKCKEISMLYNKKTTFREDYPITYTKICKNKWFELLSHMIELKKPNGYWVYETCKEEALKYSSKTKFHNNSGGAYKMCELNEWFELYSHMIEFKKPNGYWTYEKCKEEALKYNRKVDFQTYSSSAYNTSKNNGWYDDITSHMEIYIRHKSKMTFELCHIEALKYTNRSDFKKYSPSEYKRASRMLWITEICSHMIKNNMTF